VPDPPVVKTCDGKPNGSSETRQRYAQALVDDYRKCSAETQTRTCHNGTWSAWSGQGQASECAVAAQGICRQDVPCKSGACSPSPNNPLISRCLQSDGASCTDNAECVNACISGKCAPRSPAGAACDDADDCTSVACVGAGFAGASCESGLCLCPSRSYCSRNTQCLGTCLKAQCAELGSGCDLGDQDDCGDQGTCSAQGLCLRDDGARCTDNRECQHTCIGALCAPASSFDGACDDPGDCSSGFVCGGVASEQRCLKPTGTRCTDPAECASLKCGCASAECGGGQVCSE